MIGRLEIVERIGNKAHTGIELYSVFGHFVVGAFHLKDYLLGLLREEVEKDCLAEALVAEVFGNGKVLDIDKLVESPIGEDSDGVVAIIGIIGGDHEMKFLFVTMLQLPERRSFFVGEGRFE
jgi:hypothetical protein